MKHNTPQSWLWFQLELRLGEEAADDLHAQYNQKVAEYRVAREQEKAARQLPEMREYLATLQAANAPTEHQERLIARYEKRLHK